MKTILLSIGLLALCFAGIAIKLIVKKDGEFSGTCASNNPLLNKEGDSCSFCGATPRQIVVQGFVKKEIESYGTLIVTKKGEEFIAWWCTNV